MSNTVNTVTAKIAFVKAFGAFYSFKITESGSVCNIDDTSATEFLAEFQDKLVDALEHQIHQAGMAVDLAGLGKNFGVPDDKMKEIADLISLIKEDINISKKAGGDVEELLLLAGKWDREQAAGKSSVFQLDNSSDSGFHPDMTRAMDLLGKLFGGQDISTLSQESSDIGEVCPGCGEIHDPDDLGGAFEIGTGTPPLGSVEVSMENLPPEMQQVFQAVKERFGDQVKILAMPKVSPTRH